MKHPIEQEFVRLQSSGSGHSSFINFGRAVKGRGYEKSLVLRYFRKLVEKDDWKGVPIDEVSKYLAPTCQKTLILSHRENELSSRTRPFTWGRII